MNVSHNASRFAQHRSSQSCYADAMPEELQQAEDLDLRLVRCFIVVAEHQHFGRAAVELHVTASSLRESRSTTTEVGGMSA